MSRLVWMGVGAVGGIYVYRKSEQLMAEAKDRGVTGHLSVAISAVNSLLAQGQERPVRGHAEVVTLPVSVAQQAGLNVDPWRSPVRSA